MDWNYWATSSQYFYPFLTRFILSVLVLIIGLVVAQFVTKAIRRLVAQVFSRKAVADSPLGEVMLPVQSLHGSGLFSSVVYATVLFLFVAIAGEILGITFFAQVVALILSFVPNLASAVVVLVLGLLLAGVVERVTKQQFRRFFPRHAILAGTIASSSVIILFFLIAVAELGVAREFIMMLFAGVVFALALGVGLAIGLGSQDVVREMLSGFLRSQSESMNQDKGKKS